MNKFDPKILTALLVLVTISQLIVSCGNKTIKLSADLTKAFDSAPAEVKQIWEKALAADKADDYVNAQKLLDSLRPMNLSTEQIHALDTETAAFQQRLLNAVEKNDPTATKAVLEINKSKSRR